MSNDSWVISHIPYPYLEIVRSFSGNFHVFTEKFLWKQGIYFIFYPVIKTSCNFFLQIISVLPNSDIKFWIYVKKIVQKCGQTVNLPLKFSTSLAGIICIECWVLDPPPKCWLVVAIFPKFFFVKIMNHPTKVGKVGWKYAR